VAYLLPAFAGASFAGTAIRIEIDAGPVPSGTGPGCFWAAPVVGLCVAADTGVTGFLSVTSGL